jgi:hypothetical protein
VQYYIKFVKDENFLAGKNLFYDFVFSKGRKQVLDQNIWHVPLYLLFFNKTQFRTNRALTKKLQGKEVIIRT